MVKGQGSIIIKQLILEKPKRTLADQEIQNRISKHKHFLNNMEKVIDWKRINRVLLKVEIRHQSVTGRDFYSAKVMFWIMLLRSQYQLSDYQMEEQLNYNRMIPDRTQFWQFEEILWLEQVYLYGTEENCRLFGNRSNCF